MKNILLLLLVSFSMALEMKLIDREKEGEVEEEIEDPIEVPLYKEEEPKKDQK